MTTFLDNPNTYDEPLAEWERELLEGETFEQKIGTYFDPSMVVVGWSQVTFAGAEDAEGNQFNVGDELVVVDNSGDPMNAEVGQRVRVRIIENQSSYFFDSPLVGTTDIERGHKVTMVAERFELASSYDDRNKLLREGDYVRVTGGVPHYIKDGEYAVVVEAPTTSLSSLVVRPLRGAAAMTLVGRYDDDVTQIVHQSQVEKVTEEEATGPEHEDFVFSEGDYFTNPDVLDLLPSDTVIAFPGVGIRPFAKEEFSGNWNLVAKPHIGEENGNSFARDNTTRHGAVIKYVRN